MTGNTMPRDRFIKSGIVRLARNLSQHAATADLRLDHPARDASLGLGVREQAHPRRRDRGARVGSTRDRTATVLRPHTLYP